MENTLAERRLPVGAEVLPGGGVHFRVWAPRRREVEAVLEGGPAVRLAVEGDGYFSGRSVGAGAGALYRYRLDGEGPFPDPASRFQPQGPHGPSQVIDPGAFRWTDGDWKGVGRDGQVLYEMHVGTFTPEGTWESAARQLPALAELGVTVVEMMPVAEFAGRFGWGYDGVDLFAPTHLYGTPDDLRRFIDRAHAAGVGVILDVVYNHFGPDGNYLKPFSPDYFTDRYKNEWGAAINFDGEGAGPVREYFVANAGYWVEEFHFDGLRLDATQQIFDNSADHILAAITRRVRQAAGGRATLLVAENEPQEVKLVRPPAQGGYGLDMLWNDDYHHSALVALTGHNEAYYADYRGAPQEFVSAAKWGYLYQGQRYQWQKKRRGTPTFGLPPAAFVNFTQNHDQVANSARGHRDHRLTGFAQYKAMTALTLLMPGTPMLFQGQEFAASTPFYYFADHKPDLAKLVRKGRAEFLAQFPSIATPEMQAGLPDPADPRTFERSKLDLSERERHAEVYALHKDLLRLRREERPLWVRGPGDVDGAVLGPAAFVLRFFGGDGDDRLLAVNFGADLRLGPAPEPLLAPPEGRHWEVLWSSESPRYGGCGAPALDSDETWRLPGHAAVLLIPK
ncbi:MAG TPA: malto-oligosyltrehalose trehalohydrolase [Gemmataceae bacterium]|nr:malto-oligosyltrehalose trehalohydrolase [Gemmataceae bacterium]